AFLASFAPTVCLLRPCLCYSRHPRARHSFPTRRSSDLYAVIIENDTKSDGIVDIGKSVTFKELPDGEEETYTIVGSAEADPFEGKISNDSPIAKSLIGKEEDSEVTVATPGGE